ncbi:MAG: OmpA family protein [Bacteroidales bacterium]|nr:OmpA family protein [Bacteroidales bacterium]
MWNLSNAFSGYKETRFWDIIAYVQGGVIDFTNFQAGQGFFENLSKTSDFQWTMGFGFINDFRLGKRVDLYLDFSFPILPSHVYGITNGHPTDYTFKESFGKFAIKPEAKLGLIFNLGRTNFDRHSSVTPVIIPLPFTEDDYNALKKRVDELEKENAALKEEIEALKNQAPDTVYVGSNNVESPAYAFFEIGSAKLTDREKLHLDFFCDNVVANLDEEKGLLVTGSADSGTGSAKRNQQLSEQRAKAVKDYLVKKGVAEDRIEVESLGGIEGAVESRRVIVSVK